MTYRFAMRVKKLWVRGFVFSLLLVLAGAAILYRYWTNPAVVRNQVVQALRDLLPGAHVTLESAQWRLLGGFLLSDLRLTRQGDEPHDDFVYIPSAVMFHDKEKLSQGTLAIRRIEIQRPRLRLVRGEDGSWNIAGLTKPSKEMRRLPTIFVEEGTLIFSDKSKQSGMALAALSDVHLTMVNDPIAIVRIEGTGSSKELGRIKLSGTWRRDSGRIELEAKLAGGQLTMPLLQCYAKGAAKRLLEKSALEGGFDAEANFIYDPAYETPFAFSFYCKLTDGKYRNSQIPIAFEDISLEAECINNRVVIHSLAAASAATKFSGNGWLDLAEPEKNFAGKLNVQNLPLSPALCSRLPAGLCWLDATYSPRGPVDLEIDVHRKAGHWLRQYGTLAAKGVSVRFSEFPYVVSGVFGTVNVDYLKEHVAINLNSDAENRKVRLNGTVQGFGSNPEVDLTLRGSQIPIDERLITALPASSESVARSFSPEGWCNVVAVIQDKPGKDDVHCEYHVGVYDARANWNYFPLALQKVNGSLHIYPDRWEFQDFSAWHKEGQVFVRGRGIPQNLDDDWEDGYRLQVEIFGRNIGIDADLRAALESLPSLVKAWDSFAPSGKLNFYTKVDRTPGKEDDMDVALNVRGCRVQPTFFRYPLSDLCGYFRYRNNRLEIRSVKARHKATLVSIENGTVDISPGGGFYADLKNVVGNPIYPDDGFAASLPKQLQRAFGVLDWKKPIAIQTRLVVAQDDEPTSLPDIYWDGKLWLRNHKLNLGVEVENATGMLACVGRHDGRQLVGFDGNLLLTNASALNQPFRNVHAKIQIPKERPDAVLIGLKAPIFGGDVSGQVRVDLHSTIGYEMYLTASHVDLQKFGHHNLGEKSDLSGFASARLHLTGRDSNLNTLDGNGTVDIPNGKLFNLPFLVDLLKFLGLRLPDRTMFDEAHADFSIHGKRLVMNRLDLLGNAVSLTGRGDLNLDGTELQLDFYPSWARVDQLLPPGLRQLSPAVSKSLLKIEARGKISGDPKDLRFRQSPIPFLLEPLMQFNANGVRKYQSR